jgi:hypothetical protein
MSASIPHGKDYPAGRRARLAGQEGFLAHPFLKHRGLIIAAAGGAAAECGLLAALAPGAGPVAPQVTAVPSLAAYHDLRWLFADTQSWPWFVALAVALLAARAALDVALLRLAWQRGVPAPTVRAAFASCAALTLLAWALLAPSTTLTFGAALLPFSWPFLAAFPIMLGIVALLSHGGVTASWWRRLPPPRAVGWLFASFAASGAAGAVIGHLPAAAAVAVAALGGFANARAWYGLAALAACSRPRVRASVPARVLFNVPFAPIAAVLTLVLVVGLARLLLIGTIQLPVSQGVSAASIAATVEHGNDGRGSGATGGAVAETAAVRLPTAVLVVAGWGTACCDAANSLRATSPSTPMRQFSYAGMDAAGRPVRSGVAADDLPLPELGDRLAAQVRTLNVQTSRPVAVVAESEGTLAVYAMLARHPGLPVSDVVLLSPIVEPGQQGQRSGQGTSAAQAALAELNHLVGGMSPYGPGGAENLLGSVSEFGARYYAAVADGQAVRARLLVVVPLADAVTLPQCALPPGVVVVPAFHGGLLGDVPVLWMVNSFLADHTVTASADGLLRAAAGLITSVAAPWRMPDTDAACAFPNG